MKMVNINISNTTQDALLRVFDDINLQGDDLENKCIVVVPDNFSLNAEKLFFEHLNKTATFNVEFLTFSRLANKVLSENFKNINLVNKNTGLLILSKIIYENKDSLKVFGSPRLKPGVVEELYNTINQFKSSLIFPEEIEENKDVSLNNKLKDIKFLYQKFDEELSNFGIDGSTRLNLFCDQIKTSELIKTSHLYFACFPTYTFQQLNILQNLILNAQSVTFGLSATTFQANSDIYLNENLQKVLEICSACHIKANIKNFLAPRSAAKNHIINNLYSYKQNIFKLDDKSNLKQNTLPLLNVVDGRTNLKMPQKSEQLNYINQIALVEAQSKEDEVIFLAKQIKADFYNKKLQPKDINVAVCNLESYIDTIKSTFQKFGFNYYISNSENLSKSFIARDLKLLFNILENGIDQNLFFAYASSLFIKNYFVNYCLNQDESALQILFSGQSLKEVSLKDKTLKLNDLYDDLLELFENYALKYGLNYNILTCEIDNKEQNFEAFKVFRNIISQPLLLLIESIKSKTVAQDYVACLQQFFDDIYLKNTVEKLINNFANQKQFEEQKFTEKCVKQIQELMQNLSFIFANKIIDIEEFVTVLTGAIDAIKVSILPVGTNQIYVAESNSNSFLERENLYIIGASLNTFPISKADIGLLSDKDINNLNFKKNLEPTIKQINKREKYTCFELLSCFKTKLIVSYPLSLGGAQNSKSEVFNLLSSLFTINNKPLELIKTSSLINSTLFIKDNNKKQSLINMLLANRTVAKSVVSNNVVLKNIGQKLFKINNNLNFSHVYKLQNANKLFFKQNKASVSKIESFYTCPYKHFLQYGVKLKEREIFVVKPVDIGNVVHEILENFVNVLISKNMIIARDKFEDLVVFLFEKTCKKQEYEKLNAPEYAFTKRSLFLECLRVCDSIYYQIKSGEFKPQKTEYSFEYKIGEDYINGKIDRVDTYDNLIRLIDYKTGASKFSFEEIYYGKKLQLMIYALALQELTGQSVVGTFYFPIKNAFNIDGDSKYEQYKLSGTYLDSLEILKLFDKNIGNKQNTSDIVKGKIKQGKNGEELDAYTKLSCVSPKEFNDILIYAKQMFLNAVYNIKNGEILKSPCALNGFSYCKNCIYNSICGYDEAGTFRTFKRKAKKFSFDLGENNE